MLLVTVSPFCMRLEWQMNWSLSPGHHFWQLASTIQLEEIERIEASNYWRRNYSPDYQGISPLEYHPLC
jgi:hypothetical protein